MILQDIFASSLYFRMDFKKPFMYNQQTRKFRNEYTIFPDFLCLLEVLRSNTGK